MIDVHSHILPAVDDGVSTLDEAIECTLGLEALGYKTIIATPHYYPGKFVPSLAQIDEALLQVRNALSKRGSKIEILRGRECMLDFSLLGAQERDTFPFEWAGKKFQLVELPNFVADAAVSQYASHLHENGIQPILAHAERYKNVIADPKRTELYRKMGYLIQIDLLSFSQRVNPKRRECAYQILRDGSAHLVASDIHNLSQLDGIRCALEDLTKEFGKDAIVSLSTL